MSIKDPLQIPFKNKQTNNMSNESAQSPNLKKLFWLFLYFPYQIRNAF